MSTPGGCGAGRVWAESTQKARHCCRASRFHKTLVAVGIVGTAIGVIGDAVTVAVGICAVVISIVIARPVIAVAVVVIARCTGRQGKAQAGDAERDECKLSHGFLPECTLWNW